MARQSTRWYTVSHTAAGLEQAQVFRCDAPQLVVVDLDPAKSARLGEHLGLWLDRLGDEHAADVAQRRVELESLDVPGELLHAVDLTTPLDLDGDDLVGVV